MRRLTRKIKVTAGITVSSVWLVPDGYRPEKSTAIVIAHGAGNDMASAFISHMQRALARRGLLAVKFNFPYTEQGRRAPDRAPLLEATWRAVVTAVREDPRLAPGRLFLSGKSMGGRIASHIAAAGEACDGLVFFGYPLHPPNKPDKLRVEHWPQIKCPSLFIQGMRDTLCNIALLKPALKRLRARKTVHLIDEGDHSFKVPKRTGRVEEEIRAEIVDVTARWIEQVSA